MVQQIKDPALSLRWRRFDPWPGNFYMVQAQPKKKEWLYDEASELWERESGSYLPSDQFYEETNPSNAKGEQN